MRLADFSPRTLRDAVERFFDDHMLDWAAALTFYAAISLIPALVIIVGIIGLLGGDTLDSIAQNLKQGSDPGPARKIALDAVNEVRTSSFSAGLALLVGLGGTLWSASSYVGCYLRGSGVIHGRSTRYPFWRMRPLQMLITAGVIVAIAATALAVLISGPLAEQVAGLVGLEDVVAEIWDLAKWPLIVATVLTVFAVLLWASPDTHDRGFRLFTTGGVVATTTWVLGSVGYAVYVSEFGDLNKVYGSLGAVVGFLAWLWLSNMAMMFGVELNAVIDDERERRERYRDGEPNSKLAPGSST